MPVRPYTHRAARDVLRAVRPRRRETSCCRRSSWAIRGSSAATTRTRSSRASASAATDGSCPGVRSPDRQPRRGRQRGAAVPDLGRVRRRSVLRTAADRGRVLHRRRRRVGPRASAPAFARGDSQPVVSVGAAVRVNVLGFAVAEIDYVRPLDRPTAAGCGSSSSGQGSSWPCRAVGGTSAGADSAAPAARAPREVAARELAGVGPRQHR